MPLLITVDVSLSMSPFFEQPNIVSKNLTVESVLNHLLKNLATTPLNDLISLATVSDDCTILSQFDRDFSNMQKQIDSNFPKRGTKLQFCHCLQFCVTHCRSNWAHVDPVQCFFITHTNANFPAQIDDDLKQKLTLLQVPLVFLLFEHPNGKNRQKVLSCIESCPGSAVFFLKYQDVNSMKVIDAISEQYFKATNLSLHFGSLKCQIDLNPPLRVIIPENGINTDNDVTKSIVSTINIIGTVKFLDLNCPVVYTRHFINAVYDSNDSSIDLSRVPNLCVLLHGSLKVSDLVAICKIKENWFGYISCYSDGKKSNLMLYTFVPNSSKPIPWIDSVDSMTHLPFMGDVPQLAAVKINNSDCKASYLTGYQSWIHTYGIHSDLQKIFRYMRKLPEKDTLFYQELNRTLNHALSLGSIDCIDYLKRAFRKETESGSLTKAQLEHVEYTLRMLGNANLKRGDPIPMMR